jgi:hypothetical protein
MQVIVKVRCLPEEYAEKDLHCDVRAPSLCPSCTKRNRLEAHGYYDRWVSNSEGWPVEIRVRRFECEHCGITVSCLPDFAQPYRLVNNTTIQRFFAGQTAPMDVQRNEEWLKRYWRRFKHWSEQLRSIIGSAYGRASPKEGARALWQRLMARCTTLKKCTRRLVRKFRATCFGIYQCHQPRIAR